MRLTLRSTLTATFPRSSDPDLDWTLFSFDNAQRQPGMLYMPIFEAHDGFQRPRTRLDKPPCTEQANLLDAARMKGLHGQQDVLSVFWPNDERVTAIALDSHD